MGIYDMTDLIIDPTRYPWGYWVPWTPAEITTALWLDAADSDTITETGGAVSQWNDKSGYNFHGVQATQAARPTLIENAIGTKSVVRFYGGQILGFGDVLDIGTSSMVSFVVAKNSNENGTILGKVMSSPGAGRWAVRYRVDGDSKGFRFHLYGDSNTNHIVDSFGHDTDSYGIINQVIDRSRHKGFFNAQEVFDTSAVITQNLSHSSPFELGNYGHGFNEYFGGDICEVLILRYSPETGTRQKIEGYLAHKWGLETELPAGHPYKHYAPLV